MITEYHVQLNDMVERSSLRPQLDAREMTAWFISLRVERGPCKRQFVDLRSVEGSHHGNIKYLIFKERMGGKRFYKSHTMARFQ